MNKFVDVVIEYENRLHAGNVHHEKVKEKKRSELMQMVYEVDRMIDGRRNGGIKIKLPTYIIPPGYINVEEGTRITGLSNAYFCKLLVREVIPSLKISRRRYVKESVCLKIAKAKSMACSQFSVVDFMKEC